MHHGGERIVVVLGYDNVATPSDLLNEIPSLNVTDRPVDRERHAIPRDNRIENDIRIRKLAIHSV